MSKYLLIILLFLSNIAYSHGPVRQKIHETIVINAPVDIVWNVIKNFDDLSWHSDVEKTVAITGGNTKNSIRSIVLKNKGYIINQKLKKYQAEKMKYSYKIVDMSTVRKIKHLGEDIAVKIFPVMNYSAIIQVFKHAENQTKVKWTAAFYRGFMNNNPPKELNEKVAKQVVGTFLKNGLNSLEKLFNKKAADNDKDNN